MYAIFSDIHGNLEAFEAGIALATSLGATEFACLGDIVGYGPDPVASLRRVRDWPIVLKGEWEHVILDGSPTTWPPPMQNLANWTRQQIAAASDGAELLVWLRNLPERSTLSGSLLSFSPPSETWLFPEDIYNPAKLNNIAKQVSRCCFVGQSHIPGVHRQVQEHPWTYLPASESPEHTIDAGIKLLTTVGSVGQPRDGDPRASFVLFDGNRFTFQRTEYDVAKTISKIKAIDQIHNMHADRLLRGY